MSTVLAATTWGAWILASPFRPLLEYAEGWASNWLANRGLLIINLGAIYVSGELDQSKFDNAFDDALAKVQYPSLTDEQKKDIDNEIIDAFRKFAPVTADAVQLSDIPNK